MADIRFRMMMPNSSILLQFNITLKRPFHFAKLAVSTGGVLSVVPYLLETGEPEFINSASIFAAVVSAFVTASLTF